MAEDEFIHTIAEELDIDVLESEKPEVSANGVTNVLIKTIYPLNGQYRAYVVKDPSLESSSLEESATLASFYNSQFVSRILTLNKVSGPFGKHEVCLRLIDDKVQTMHSVFVTKVDPGHRKKVLSLDDLCEVAKAVAKYHFINETVVSTEVFRAITENHSHITEYDENNLQKVIRILERSLHTPDRNYFSSPSQVMSKVNYLVEKVKRRGKPPVKDDVPLVLCHGKLNASSLLFEDSELKEITNWENTHFADHAKDLAHLIISTADPEVRRSSYLSVFRSYYYTLVDVRPPHFEIELLRDQYLQYQKNIVLSEIDPLLYELSIDNAEDVRKRLVRRWESALDDAYTYESEEYISDNEDCLFSK
ncbi:unnamed protein product [Auanema sp. JU1783]|nr:unnamed protein product [Auanema sp. JU1783]